jgi:hypothetical protein
LTARYVGLNAGNHLDSESGAARLQQRVDYSLYLTQLDLDPLSAPAGTGQA